MRDSNTDLAVVEGLSVPVQLREQCAELHSEQAFKVDCVVFGLWNLKFWHEREYFEVENDQVKSVDKVVLGENTSNQSSKMEDNLFPETSRSSNQTLSLLQRNYMKIGPII